MEMAAHPLSFLQEDEKSYWGARGFPEGFRADSLWDTKRMVRDHCDKKYLVIFYCCYDDGKEVWR